MKDTHTKTEKLFLKLMKKRSNKERFLMGCSMYQSAKEIVEASLRNQNPKISKSELRKQTFLRFYRNDFPPEILRRILPKLKF